MKKILSILVTVLVIGSLLLIGFMIFIGTAMGTRFDNTYENQNSEAELYVKDNFPQGQMTYELYFVEFDGRMENLPVEIVITGNKIIVYNNEKQPLTGGEILIKGTLLKHKYGKWIIGKTEKDLNVEEIGGCSGGPIPINFKTKIIEWC